MLSPTITEINNLIMTANYISPIDTLHLIVFKNLAHTLKYSILVFMSINPWRHGYLLDM